MKQFDSQLWFPREAREGWEFMFADVKASQWKARPVSSLVQMKKRDIKKNMSELIGEMYLCWDL